MKMELYAVISLMVLVSTMGHPLEPVPVASFSNVCALTATRINEFLNCTLTRALVDNRINLIDDFKKQVSDQKSVEFAPRKETIRMSKRGTEHDAVETSL